MMTMSHTHRYGEIRALNPDAQLKTMMAVVEIEHQLASRVPGRDAIGATR